MSIIENEQTKLLANALDRASTACFTVGIATPTAGYLYGVVNFGNQFGSWQLFAAFLGWFILALALHLAARRVLKDLKP